MVPTGHSTAWLVGMVIAVLVLAVAGSAAAAHREELRWRRFRRTRGRDALIGFTLCLVMGIAITVIEWWTGR